MITTQITQPLLVPLGETIARHVFPTPVAVDARNPRVAFDVARRRLSHERRLGDSIDWATPTPWAVIIVGLVLGLTAAGLAASHRS